MEESVNDLEIEYGIWWVTVVEPADYKPGYILYVLNGRIGENQSGPSKIKIYTNGTVEEGDECDTDNED